MRLLIPIFIFAIPYVSCLSQEKVTFFASDSLKITADLYVKDYNLPFILLFHQAGSSRGEYSGIARRLMNLDYNCLAVDLRNGEKMKYIPNETAARAKELNIPHTFIDAGKDIEAAISFTQKISKRPIVLFGSSYSASLCLIEAKKYDVVKAVVAFSPGEYFRPEVIVKDEIAGLNVPVFISSSDMEYDYITQMFSDFSLENLTIYRPKDGKGIHGAKTLWETSDTSDECWLELLMFFKKLKKYKNV